MNKFSHIELDEKVLAEKTLQYIYSIKDTYKECALFINILNPLEKYGDLKEHEFFLKERLSKLKFIIDYDQVTFENNLSGFLDHSYEQLENFGNRMFAIENFSKEIFWANKEEEKIYRKISDFSCFNEIIIPEEKFRKTIINTPFNLDAWIEYYQNLLKLKFSEFSEEMMVGNDTIKYREFMDDYFLGIATNYKLFKNKFKSDYNAEPHHKLIIFKKLNKKKIDKIVTFEKFIHPHFCPPAYSFGSYFYAKNKIQVGEKEMSLKYVIEREFLADGNVKLSMSEEFGEYLKRHAYFYYDMLYHTTKEYIKFIEESFEP